MGIIPRSYQTEPDLDSLFLELNGKINGQNLASSSVTSSHIVDGTIVNADVNASAGINMTKTDLNSAVARHDIWAQDRTSNTLTPNQVIYRGWGFVTGTGVQSATKVVTLPNSGYDDQEYDLSVYIIGTKDGSDPTSRHDADAAYPHNLSVFNSTTADSATQFQVRIQETDAVNIVATRRILFSWIAIGTKA